MRTNLDFEVYRRRLVLPVKMEKVYLQDVTLSAWAYLHCFSNDYIPYLQFFLRWQSLCRR